MGKKNFYIYKNKNKQNLNKNNKIKFINIIIYPR